jgi:hypothetical protein
MVVLIEQALHKDYRTVGSFTNGGDELELLVDILLPVEVCK